MLLIECLPKLIIQYSKLVLLMSQEEVESFGVGKLRVCFRIICDLKGMVDKIFFGKRVFQKQN